MKNSAISLILATILFITGFIVFRGDPEPFSLSSDAGIEIEGFLLGSQLPEISIFETPYFNEAIELSPINLALENPYTVNWPNETTLFIYDLDLEAWREYRGSRPAELNQFTKLSIGDRLDVDNIEHLSLRDELIDSAPEGVVGYTINEVIFVEGSIPAIVLADKLEEGGCEGNFMRSNEKRRSERASELQLLVNDRLEKINLRIIADWYIDSSVESCKLESRK